MNTLVTLALVSAAEDTVYEAGQAVTAMSLLLGQMVEAEDGADADTVMRWAQILEWLWDTIKNTITRQEKALTAMEKGR